MNSKTTLGHRMSAMLVTLSLVACGTPQPTASPVPIPATSAPTSVPTALRTSEPGTFAIYVLPQHTAAPASAIDVLDLQQEPILTIDDIRAYTWQTHTIALTASAHARIRELQVPVDGTPFVICLGHEPIYIGAFWPMHSSLSFDGVVIILPLTDEDAVPITLGYPSTVFFTGEDPRSDPRIRQSLERVGKLE